MEDFSMMPVDWNSKFSRFQSLYYMTISFHSCHSYWWIAFIVCQYIYIHHHYHEWLNLKCCMVGQTSAFNSHINSRQSDQGFYVQCKSAGSQAGELRGEIRWKETCKDSHPRHVAMIQWHQWQVDGCIWKCAVLFCVFKFRRASRFPVDETWLNDSWVLN